MKHHFRSAILAAGLSLMPLSALADARTEAFVKENANEVLATLNNPALSATERTATFNAYMDQFADIDSISNFVIGRYSRRFSPDELARYRRAFRAYALAVYETELDAYRGEAVIVRNSVDRSPTDSIVNTYIRRENGPDVDVRWRVLERNGEFQVVDVALNFNGNLIWLAIEQRAQFITLLDRTNGSADALIAEIERMTGELIRQRRTG